MVIPTCLAEQEALAGQALDAHSQWCLFLWHLLLAMATLGKELLFKYFILQLAGVTTFSSNSAFLCLLEEAVPHLALLT